MTLVDRAVAILQRQPLRWALVALSPCLPLLISLLLFVHFHRVRWLDQDWNGSLQFGSLTLSSLVLIGLALRSVGQGRGLAAVVAEVHPGAPPASFTRLPSVGTVQSLSLAAIGVLSIGLFLLGVLLGVLPGILATALLVPVFGLLAVDELGLVQALRRGVSFSSGVLSVAFWVCLLQVLLWAVAWVNLVVAAQLVVLLVKILTAVDVTTFARWLAPTNLVFVCVAAGLAWLALEPLWLVVRGLLYLDARFARTGMDLLDRWDELESGSAGTSDVRKRQPVRNISLVLLVLSVLVPLQAFADGRGAVQPAGIEWPQADGSKGLLSVEAFSALLDSEAQAIYLLAEGSGEWDPLNLANHRPALWNQDQWVLELGAGQVLRLDTGGLSAQLPEGLPPERTQQLLLQLVLRLENSSAFAEALVSGTEPGAGGLQDPTFLQRLLKEELDDGDYDFSFPAHQRGRYRSGLLSGLAAAWGRRASPDLVQYEIAAQRDLSVMPVGILVIGFLLLVLFGVLLGSVIRSRRVSHNQFSNPSNPGTAAAVSTLIEQDSAGLRLAAGVAAEAGDFDAALRALFLALLIELDRSGELDLDPSSSNGEYQQAFRGPVQRREQFSAVVSRCEAHCYGGRPAGAEQFAEVEALVDRMIPVTSGLGSSSAGCQQRLL
ncbi:MAG: hypothetical protein CMP23_17675 [Rickettsiales bacterium]|nr:hypothetical protein [Rickettsiales bacterium]